MTPPEAPATKPGTKPPAVSVCLQILKKRPDFLAAARAGRHPGRSMLVQARQRDDGDPVARVGFTCSKKVGNAVARNRAKRRLREVARQVLRDHGKPGWDYVLVGRRDETIAQPFAQLLLDLETALSRLHKTRK